MWTFVVHICEEIVWSTGSLCTTRDKNDGWDRGDTRECAFLTRVCEISRFLIDMRKRA